MAQWFAAGRLRALGGYAVLETLQLVLARPQTWVVLVLNVLLFFRIWRLGQWLLGRLQALPGRLRSGLGWLWSSFMLYALAAVLVHLLALTELEPLYSHGEAISTWFRASVGQIAAIVVLAVLAWQLVGGVSARIVPSGEFSRRSVRVQTLKGVTESSLRVAILVLAIISVLQNVGVNTATLLAGVSVVGLAVGFGAQSLIKDVFNGFFILLEDQYGVGDVVKVNAGPLTGTVERLNLRVTVLRDLSGTVHIVPNGQIQTISVSSKEWSRVVALVSVSYQSDLETALGVLNEVSEALYQDEGFGKNFLSPPELHGVTRLAPGGIELRALYTVHPKAQWALEREFNRRVKESMDAAGVTIQSA